MSFEENVLVRSRFLRCRWGDKELTTLGLHESFQILPQLQGTTLPETNISPENRPLEKEIPIGNHHFLGAKMLVSGRVSFEKHSLKLACAMVKSRNIGDGHPTFNRNPYNGYINPYYWVDDHPLLYGNNGSLDPGTHGPWKKAIPKGNDRIPTIHFQGRTVSFREGNHQQFQVPKMTVLYLKWGCFGDIEIPITCKAYIQLI